MKGRIGWLALILFVLAWDLFAARTNGESLTFAFRRSVAETAWRWPAMILIGLLLLHLFLPVGLRRYDPIDQLYHRFNPATSASPSTTPRDPRPLTGGRSPDAAIDQLYQLLDSAQTALSSTTAPTDSPRPAST